MRRKDRKISEQAEIEEIIKKADVCRIAMIDGDEPYIVALNFGYKHGKPSVLYFHCANEGRKIDVIKRNNKVCFQMDVDHVLITAKKACGFTMKFKSVVGQGRIHIVSDIKEKIDGLNYIMKQYTGIDQYEYEEKMLDITTILRLEIEEITGKQKQ